eukprot:TRINITY_DN37926_c0_g1_i1.p1 TRINITY_DN37926_c0_g1~~TRINITY_DN37926_c0_g1_i1.p1  ORF type:complete len:423 (+),score=44.53 TRINITY_DN37926_c0_g1_i1:179-1447(+)
MVPAQLGRTVAAFVAASLTAAARGGQGGAGCFDIGGVLTYENCCLPRPNAVCFDGFYTPERCCVQDAATPAAASRPAAPVTTSEAAETTRTRGDPQCWGYGVLTYERCCLPRPLQFCFTDRLFTAERCCGTPKKRSDMTAIERLRDELFTGVDPYKLLDSSCGAYDAEDHYPDSHLTSAIVRMILSLLPDPPELWLEIGSFMGRSAITTASTLKAINASTRTGIICIDPWTGVAEMWAARKGFKEEVAKQHPLAENALKMDIFGYPRVYETFLANVRAAGHADLVMPLRVSSITGMRLLRQLRFENRLDNYPEVIYLDSAHEEGETYLEVKEAWKTLASPGVLLGDDWSRWAVRDDVSKFARSLGLPEMSADELWRFDTTKEAATQPVPGLALLPSQDGTWVLVKPAGYKDDGMAWLPAFAA